MRNNISKRGWDRFQSILGSSWFALSGLAWLHSLSTGWLAVVVSLSPIWFCGARCSCSTSFWQRVKLLGGACLAGIVLGAIEAAVLHVIPTFSTGFLMMIALLSMVEAIGKEQRCHWKLLRAGFLMSWIVSYLTFRLYNMPS